MRFGEKLRAARLSAGFTQDELAIKCGMKKQNISRYETSDREPNIRTAKKMADVLGISLEELVHDCENATSEFELSNDEVHLITLYRRADEIDRQTIKNILSRYDEDGASARSSTG